MALSLRARLTMWYSALLLAALSSFVAFVLWAHWQFLVRQYDESLETLSVMANNVIHEEMGERSNLALAAEDTEEVVRAPDHIVKILDENGRPLNPKRPEFPLDDRARSSLSTPGISTVTTDDGSLWRFVVRNGQIGADSYLIVVGVPLKDVRAHWRALLQASIVGLPLVLAVGVAGGWWLGRHGLRPLTAMAAQARDITASTTDSRLDLPVVNDELRQLGESFNRVLGRLGNALADQRRFMADASHELRTPVSIIRTASQVTLSRPTRDADEYREALEAVAQQSARLARLVDDMFVLARADAGGYPMSMTDVDLGELARECVRDLGLQASERAIDMTSDVPVAAFVHGDEALLRRAIVNLLQNAIVYTPVRGRVGVTLRADDEGAELRVSDSGPGIPPDDQGRVFERFVRLDPARGAGGAGLGLAIARWIIESHGGALSLERSGPDGSVFAVRLPVIAGGQADGVERSA
jgi:heavy metal sensor kinase